MGSLIALEAAARAPERVTQLVMVGTAVADEGVGRLLTTARDEPEGAIDMVTAFSHRIARPEARRILAPAAWVQRRLSRADAPRAGGAARRSTCSTTTSRCATATPTACRPPPGCAARRRLMLGERDQMTTPRQTRDIAAALKAKVIMVPAGHDLMAEAPEEVLAALRKVLV